MPRRLEVLELCGVRVNRIETDFSKGLVLERIEEPRVHEEGEGSRDPCFELRLRRKTLGDSVTNMTHLGREREKKRASGRVSERENERVKVRGMCLSLCLSLSLYLCLAISVSASMSLREYHSPSRRRS